MCDSVSVFRVQANVPAPSPDVLCRFQEPDSSMTLCWLMYISGITKAVRF